MKRSFPSRLRLPLSSENAWRYGLLALFAIAILLRLNHYLGNRALWLDEAMLVWNLQEAGFWELLQPLDHNQLAPIGFLWLMKGILAVFGDSEYALRLMPMFAGIASLFFLYSLAVRVSGRWVALMALGLFAVSKPAIYFAAEAKQYSTDIAITLSLYLLTAYCLRRRDGPSFLLLGLAGALVVWFSHPAAFVLAGIGATLGTWFLLRGERRDCGRIMAMAAAWLSSFALSYLATRPAESEVVAFMRESAWAGAFAPLPDSLEDLHWYVESYLALFGGEVAAFGLTGIAGFVFLIGATQLWQSQRLWFFLLLSPLVITLAVSAFALYPFASRLLLFELPVILILIAAGLERLRRALSPDYRLAWLLLLGFLLLFPAVHGLRQVVAAIPYERQEMKVLLSHIADGTEPYDAIYINHEGFPAFRYYNPRYALSEDVIVGGELWEDWGSYTAKVDEIISHRRVWVIFSHFRIWQGIPEVLLLALDAAGTKLDSVSAVGSEAYLYQFDKQPHKVTN